MIDASVIILTKNGDKYLSEVLRAVSLQQKRRFETIVIDSGSNDKTLKIVSRYKVRLVTIKAGSFNHGETRNLGAQLARGRYVVFLTQDATPANCLWLDSLLAPFDKDSLIVGCYGRHIPRKGCNPLLKRQITRIWQTGSKKPMINTKLENSHFSNTSSALLRQVVLAFPFPKTDFAEDVQWELEVLKAGYKTCYTPLSTVYHSHDYSLMEQVRQNYDHSKAMKKIKIKNKQYLIFLKMFMVWFGDFSFLLKDRDVSTFSKPFWFIYSPLWHGAINIGSILGSLESIPGTFNNLLSHQTRLKNQ